MTQFRSIADLEEHVRSNTQSAALTAGLLILFGFFAIGLQTGDDLFSLAGNWLVYALRIGGLAMVIVAVWCSLGHGLALLADAVVSGAVGAVLIVTGVLMLIDGGAFYSTAINCICGVFLTTLGIRNGQVFCAAVRLCRRTDPACSAEPIDDLFGHAHGGDSSRSGADGSGNATAIPSEIVEMADREPKRPHAHQGGRFAVEDEPISLADFGGLDQPGGSGTTGAGGDGASSDTERRFDGGARSKGRGSLADFAEDDGLGQS